MPHAIQSNKYYLTNNQIVLAGVMALTPFGILGIPDLIVRRKKQALWHLLLLIIGTAMGLIVGYSAFFFVAVGEPTKVDDFSIIGAHISGLIILGSYIWSVWEGAWILGHVEDVRAQANQ